MARTILQHIANAAAILLTMKEPFPAKYEPPQLTGTHQDRNGYPVLEIRAENYRDAGTFTEGTTYPGNVSRSLVHLGGKRWEARIEPWDTCTNEITQPTKPLKRKP